MLLNTECFSFLKNRTDDFDEKKELLPYLNMLFPSHEANLLININSLPKQETWQLPPKGRKNENTAFLGEVPQLPDFNYFYSMKCFQQRIQLNNRLCNNKEDAVSLSLPPLLCKDHILYFKEENSPFIYEISLNAAHPHFVMRNLKDKKKIHVMPWEKVSEIVDMWANDEKLTSKLHLLYKKYVKENKIAAKPKTLPSLSELYIWQQHRIRYYENFYHHLENSDIYYLPPKLCDDKQIIYLTNDIIYKIDCNYPVTFEKMCTGEVSLLTETELNAVLSKAVQKDIFKVQKDIFENHSNHITDGLRILFKRDIEPVFASNNCEFISLDNVKHPYSFKSLMKPVLIGQNTFHYSQFSINKKQKERS